MKLAKKGGPVEMRVLVTGGAGFIGSHTWTAYWRRATTSPSSTP